MSDAQSPLDLPSIARILRGAGGRLAAGAAAGLLVGIVLGATLPRQYESSVTFTPEAQSSGGLGGGLAGLAGLAGQFNLGSVALGAAAAAPDFYASVLTSRALLTETLRTPFADSTLAPGAVPQPLLALLRVRPRFNSADTVSAGIRKLDRLVSVTVDRRPNVVILSVRMPTPALSAAVANRMVDLLNEFNLKRRQTSSGAQARFTRERLATAEAELRAAQEEQSAFLLRNRTYRGAPLLELQAERLATRVQLKQEVYSSLAKSYEEARIAEVRDVPVLTVVDPATLPDKPASPSRVLLALTGLLAGVGVALLVTAVGAYRSRPAAVT